MMNTFLEPEAEVTSAMLADLHPKLFQELREASLSLDVEPISAAIV